MSVSNERFYYFSPGVSRFASPNNIVAVKNFPTITLEVAAVVGGAGVEAQIVRDFLTNKCCI